MKVLQVLNNGTMTLDLTEEESHMLIEYAVNDILKKQMKKLESEENEIN